MNTSFSSGRRCSAASRCRLAAKSPRQRGFSLIEVMVGLVIGMLAVVIMMQLFAGSEASKRNTTGGNDALVNGTIALYGLERDIRQSGYGISAYGIVGCGVSYTAGDAGTATLPLAPVVVNPATSVIPAGDANTDTVLVIYGNSEGSSEGDPMTATSTATRFTVSTPTSFAVGNILVAQSPTRPTTCNLAPATVSGISGDNLTVTSGTAGLPVGSPVYNLGSAPAIRAYAIRNGNLTVCDYVRYNCGNAAYVTTLNAAVWVPVASNIVAMRAQYGRDTSGISGSTMSGVVDTYDQTTPASSADTSGLTPACAWARALTLRLVLVARSSTYDKAAPTSVAPTWAGTTVSTTAPTNPTAVTLTLSGNSTWQNYRYKTLQTIIPLRNAMWQGGQPSYQGGSGC